MTTDDTHSYLLVIRFYPSEARKIAEKIMEEELKDKVYDEDDAKEWSLAICERIKSSVKGQRGRSHADPFLRSIIYIMPSFAIEQCIYISSNIHPPSKTPSSHAPYSPQDPKIQGRGASDHWPDDGSGCACRLQMSLGHIH